MPLNLYNSLTKKVEPFTPADPARITFYTCGPTVYDFAHIGNFRSFLMADVLRRWLESPLCELANESPAQKAQREKHGRKVVHVMNITDVGHMTDDNSADGEGVDRMEEGGRRLLEAKKSGKLPPGAPDIDPRNPAQIAAFYAGAFLEDAKLLGLKVAHEADTDPTLMPRPTQKIPEMIAMIRDLLDKGYAYLVGAPSAPGTAVYFDVQKFPDYGQLSGNTLDRLRAGAGGRVSESNQAGKRHPADFMLWKVDPSHVMKWPFEGVGPGYPGWHLECSAMARERLGDVIDLHSGGEDNIFPHHECEIAQSRCSTGNKQFARHWLHVRHLMVEGEKMSKSKGNFYTIRDLLEKGGDEITPAAIRLELIKTHYRANANFTIQGLKDSARRIRRWRRRALGLMKGGITYPIGDKKLKAQGRYEGFITDIRDAFDEDDLNINQVASLLDQFTSTLSDDQMDAVYAKIMSALNKIQGTAKTPTTVAMLDRLADEHLPTRPGTIEEAQAMIQKGLNDGTTYWELGVMHLVDRVLGVIFTPPFERSSGGDESAIDSLIAARNAAKKNKNFAEADRIRAELTAMGIEIKDTAQGTTWSRKASL